MFCVVRRKFWGPGAEAFWHWKPTPVQCFFNISACVARCCDFRADLDSQSKVSALQGSVEDTLRVLDEMRLDLEGKTAEVERIRMEREEMGFLVLQSAQEAKGHLTDSLYGQSIQEDLDSSDGSPLHGRPGPNFSQQIRLEDLKGTKRHQVLRYIVERVSDLHMEARNHIVPTERGDHKNVLFPKIDRGKHGTRSLVARSSLDSERQRVVAGGDHLSEGGRG